jgi:hypothetical protein
MEVSGLSHDSAAFHPMSIEYEAGYLREETSLSLPSRLEPRVFHPVAWSLNRLHEIRIRLSVERDLITFVMFP